MVGVRGSIPAFRWQDVVAGRIVAPASKKAWLHLDLGNGQFLVLALADGAELEALRTQVKEWCPRIAVDAAGTAGDAAQALGETN